MAPGINNNIRSQEAEQVTVHLWIRVLVKKINKRKGRKHSVGKCTTNRWSRCRKNLFQISPICAGICLRCDN